MLTFCESAQLEFVRKESLCVGCFFLRLYACQSCLSNLIIRIGHKKKNMIFAKSLHSCISDQCIVTNTICRTTLSRFLFPRLSVLSNCLCHSFCDLFGIKCLWYCLRAVMLFYALPVLIHSGFINCQGFLDKILRFPWVNI